MGDGVLVYFGYPDAHEDDPEQAVRAGLALIEGIGLIGDREPLQVRLGIATGLVVVGDLIGSGSSNDKDVLGEVPNLAARLLALAEPNTIVIADSTRRLVGSVFALEDLGFKDSKALPSLNALGGCWARTASRAASKRCAPLRHRSSIARRKLNSCFGAGHRQEAAKACHLALRRTRHRQITPDGGAQGFARCGAVHRSALFLLTPSPEQRALPGYQLLERAAGFGRDDTPAVKAGQAGSADG